jgi:predicted DNA-binding protein
MEPLNRSVTVKLSASLAARLNATARKHKKPRSVIVREALEARLASEKLTPLELVQDLVGSIQGPADLSTREPYAELESVYRRDQRSGR